MKIPDGMLVEGPPFNEKVAVIDKMSNSSSTKKVDKSSVVI